MLLDFGQPANGIFQFAYVTGDLRATIDDYVNDARVGPWFLLDRLESTLGTYRGQPSRAAVKLAMAFTGHAQIELIEPLDEEPSVYKELLDTNGPGFHHFGKLTTDLARESKRLQTSGFIEAFRMPVPTGGEVVYFDTKGHLPGFLEIFEGTPPVNELFTKFYHASVGWNGDDPVRPFLGS